MVSNLPAWTFDDQLVNDDKCWVVTSESKDHEFMGTHSQVPLHGSRRPKGLRLIRDIGYTALFGASDLNTRGLNHHLQFPIPVDIGLLDFDLNDKRCAIEIGKARVTCDGLISARLKEVEFLDDIHEAAVQELQAVFFPDELRLRTALVREMRLTGSEVAGYHLWASRGFDNDADENLKLSRSGTLIEECLSPAGSEGASADLETEEGDHRFYRVGRPGYLKSVTPPDRKWAMAFPLADPTSRQSGLGRVSVAVTFDGDLPITGRVLEIRRKLKELTRRWQTY
jgi:hypothetical protein